MLVFLSELGRVLFIIGMFLLNIFIVLLIFWTRLEIWDFIIDKISQFNKKLKKHKE